MSNTRRNFLKNMGIMGASGMMIPNSINNNKNEDKNLNEMTKPKVIFFDVNETLLDLTQMKSQVGAALNGRADLLSLWFTTMLQYSLVTTASNQYEHFGNIGAAALQMVAANNNIDIKENKAREVIVNALRGLPAHPEVKAALTKLKDSGYKLVSFTNSSNEGVKKQFESAGLTEYFDERLSVEEIGKFKPHSDTYAWASRKMGIKPSESLLVAAHGWDIAGALWAGWRGAFIKRAGAQLYPLAPKPEINESNLEMVAKKLILLK